MECNNFINLCDDIGILCPRALVIGLPVDGGDGTHSSVGINTEWLSVEGAKIGNLIGGIDDHTCLLDEW